MAIRFHCPGCNARLSIAPAKAGTTVRCPRCRVEMEVPPAVPVATPAGVYQVAATGDIPSPSPTTADSFSSPSPGRPRRPKRTRSRSGAFGLIGLVAVALALIGGTAYLAIRSVRSDLAPGAGARPKNAAPAPLAPEVVEAARRWDAELALRRQALADQAKEIEARRREEERKDRDRVFGREQALARLDGLREQERAQQEALRVAIGQFKAYIAQVDMYLPTLEADIKGLQLDASLGRAFGNRGSSVGTPRETVLRLKVQDYQKYRTSLEQARANLKQAEDQAETSRTNYERERDRILAEIK